MLGARRSHATATRIASRASSAVQALAARPAATSTNAAISARYASANRSWKFARVLGGRRAARLDRPQRQASSQPTTDAVAGAQQLHPDVVAERVVTRDGEDAERPAREPERDHAGVDVPVLLELREVQHGAVRVDLDLSWPVTNRSASKSWTLKSRKRPPEAGMYSSCGGADRGPPSAPRTGPRSIRPRRGRARPEARVEPALEAHLERDARPPDVLHDVGGRREVERDRLLAEREPASAHAWIRLRVGRRRRRDHHGVRRRQQLLRRRDRAGAGVGGHLRGPVGVDVGDQDVVDLVDRAERGGVGLPHAPDPDHP